MVHPLQRGDVRDRIGRDRDQVSMVARRNLADVGNLPIRAAALVVAVWIAGIGAIA